MKILVRSPMVIRYRRRSNGIMISGSLYYGNDVMSFIAGESASAEKKIIRIFDGCVRVIPRNYVGWVKYKRRLKKFVTMVSWFTTTKTSTEKVSDPFRRLESMERAYDLANGTRKCLTDYPDLP